MNWLIFLLGILMLIGCVSEGEGIGWIIFSIVLIIGSLFFGDSNGSNKASKQDNTKSGTNKSASTSGSAVKICSRCGNKQTEGQVFCEKCGRKF